jgi:hypothetical protein
VNVAPGFKRLRTPDIEEDLYKPGKMVFRKILRAKEMGKVKIP